MPFDLSTAKPAVSGFDLRTAKPVTAAKQDPSETDPESPEYQAKYGNGGTKQVLMDLWQNTLKSPAVAADVLLHLGRQAVATPVAGIAGLASLAIPGVDSANVVRKTQAAIAGEPISEGGKQVMGAVAYPFEKLAEGGEAVGRKVQDVTGSPALATAADTAIQAIPALLSRGARGAVRNVAGDVARGNFKPKSAAAAPNLATTPAPTAAGNVVSPPEAAARQYVADKLNLDWDALSQATKTKLTVIAQDASKLDALDPAATAREARLGSMTPPVPATRGQLMRDPVQLRNETNVAATDAGAPIRDVHLAANQALLDNLETIKGRVSGTGETAATGATREQAGAAVQGAARAKAAHAKGQVDALYRAARETEPNALAPLQPVTDLLTANPEIQHLGWVQSWLNKGAKARQNLDAATRPEGAAAPEGPVAMTDATLAELADLRSQATAIARTGGKEGYYAGEVVKAINNAMEAVPEGAKAWRAANDAFRKYKTEFAEQGAVSELVDQSTRTDRVTALENTTKAILSGSLEDVRNVKRTLLTGGDEATRTAGKKAWREVRRQVVDDIKQEATKGVALNQDGSPNIGAAALKRAIDKYGPEKLDELFGPGTRKQLDRILEATRDVKTQPPNQIAGSSTVANVLAFLEKGLGKVPLAGDLTVGAIKLGKKAADIGAGARETTRATTTPLSDIAAKATKRARRDEMTGKLKDVAGSAATAATPLSQVGAQRQR